MAATEPTFELRDEGGKRVLALAGDWTVRTIGGGLDDALRAIGEPAALDVSDLGRLDVAGAFILNRTLRDQPPTFQGRHPSAERLLLTVREAASHNAETPAGPRGLSAWLEGVGKSVAGLGGEAQHSLAFLGLALVTFIRIILRPNRIRWVSVFAVMESAGLAALPIVMLLTFFVGMVVAFLGARVLSDFGASVFTVELVAFSMLREFGVVITAILLAGRTDSAFTAEIGAMKMRQEIDAMRVLGLDPIEALVVPRLMAMVVMLPLLTFAATMAGLCGGMVVAWASLDISPTMFVTRIQEAVPQQHFWVGMIKTPFMAVVLALVGCRHGLETGTDVTSLGRRTTSAVVQAIFLVIVMDALFAIWFLEMDW